MNKEEALQKLQMFAQQGLEVLRLLEGLPGNADLEGEIRELATNLKKRLEAEYLRTQPERAQRSMSLFELSVYSPTIEETWKESGIRRLKIDGAIDKKWQQVMESIAYKASKYLT